MKLMTFKDSTGRRRFVQVEDDKAADYLAYCQSRADRSEAELLNASSLEDMLVELGRMKESLTTLSSMESDLTAMVAEKETTTTELAQ